MYAYTCDSHTQWGGCIPQPVSQPLALPELFLQLILPATPPLLGENYNRFIAHTPINDVFHTQRKSDEKAHLDRANISRPPDSMSSLSRVEPRLPETACWCSFEGLSHVRIISSINSLVPLGLQPRLIPVVYLLYCTRGRVCLVCLGTSLVEGAWSVCSPNDATILY